MMSETIQREGKSQDGQALVEFTLVFVLFVMLMFMIIEGARLILAHSTVSHAARAGVRYAIVRGSGSTCGTGCPATPADIEQVVRKNASTLNLTKVEVCWWKTTPDCVNNPADAKNKGTGSIIQVRAQYDFSPVVGLIAQTKVSLSSTAQMVIAQ